MTRQSEHETAAAAAIEKQPTAGNPDPYDISMDSVPAGWVDAQIASPLGAGTAEPLTRPGRINTIPTGQTSPFIANIAALGAAFIGGTGWYLAHIFDVYRGPWIAVLLGALIALMVRSAGVGHRSYNAMLSVATYLATLLTVLIFITNRDLTAIYGSAYDFQDFENTLLRTRFQNGWHLLAYGVGILVAGQLAFLRRTE